MWGAAALGSAQPPPRRPRCDPAESSFCLLWGGGWEGREPGQRAGRPDVAGDGLGGVRGGDPRRPSGLPERAPGGAAAVPSPGPARRPASPVAAAARARCVGLPRLLLLLGLFEGGKRAGRRKKRSVLLVSKS